MRRVRVEEPDPIETAEVGDRILFFSDGVNQSGMGRDKCLETLTTVTQTKSVWVNLGWGVLNLLPVLPLDGGMIVASLVESIWGPGALYTVRVLSVVVCVGLCALALSVGWLWSAFLAGVLAISNLQARRGG